MGRSGRDPRASARRSDLCQPARPQINPGFYDTLNNVAESLVNYPNSLIDVYGFTDTTARPPPINACPNSARRWLPITLPAKRGVARARIATQGYGEQYDYLRGQDRRRSR